MFRLALSKSVCSFALFCLFATLALLAPANAQNSVQGQWQTLATETPINPVHMALMHNGKILIVTGSGNDKTVQYFQGGVWDPQTQTLTTQPVTWDMFCNGMSVLYDGRPFIAGGTLLYTPNFEGLAKSAYFDPATGNFVDLPSMAHGRWYPTATELGDGRVMVSSGLTETGVTNVTVEIYKVGSGWSQQFNMPFTPPLYPRFHLLPNGKVFYSGSTTPSFTFDPSNQTWTQGPSTNYGNTRTYGSSVLLPLMPSKGYAPKVMIFGGASPATNTTEIIDLSAANPVWVNGPNMVQPRIEMNATLLPNGKILTSGGSQVDEDGTTASLKAEIYDPNAGPTGSFTSAGSNVFPRLYHSNSILLPDATVLLAGSNPHQGTYDPHLELYTPPYLFNPDGSPATRPTITSITPGVIGYGATFQVQTPDAANISSVVLMRPGAVTHAFDMDQRLVGVNFTAASGVLTVTAPPNGNIAPPGYYMLFILNSAGVPSVAQFLQLSLTPTDLAPTGSITNPPSDVVISPGQSITFTGSGSDPDGSIASYSWAFPGGSPSSASGANPPKVTYSNPGTYFASLTVTDNQGLTDPSPAMRVITVTPDFSLNFTPSAQSVSPGNGTSFNVKVTSGAGFTGTVNFSVSGLPAGATASFNPPTVTASGSTTLSIATTGATPAGTFPLTVTGTSGTSSHSVMPAFVVFASPDTVPPSAPSVLTATAASNIQINLAWNASTDNIGVTGYSVERCQGSGCSNFTQIATLTAVTSYTDTPLVSSTSYTYRVRASDAAGNFSAYSNLATATTQAPPPASIFLVQQTATRVSSGANTVSLTFTNPSNSGDLIVLGLKWGDQNVSVASVTDSRNNTYSSAVGPTTWSGTAKRAQIFYAKNIVGTGAPITVTVTFTANSSSSIYLYQFEYGNADPNAPLDAFAAGVGSATNVSSGNATVNFANELIFGFSIADSVAINPGPGFTAESTFQGNLVEDRTVSTPGSYAATGTGTGVSNWFMLMATFKPGSSDTIPPTAPSSLTALAASPTQINLSWTAATDNVAVTGYQVQRCAGSGCTNFSTVATLPATPTTFNDSSLAASTTYNYQVIALDAASNTSLPSNVAGAMTLADTSAPTAPSSLTATAATSIQVNLSWSASTDNVGVTGYLVERCTGVNCSNFAQIASVSGSTTIYSDTSATGSTSYSYQIVATDAANNLSLPSNTASVTTPGVPAAPSALNASASSATQIDLNWTNNAVNQTGFKVERSPDGVTFTQIGTTGAATTTFSDPGRAPGTTYSYRVRATNSAGDSAYSNIASATTLADTTPPSTPANLTATPASSTQINLSWSASTDNVAVTSYVINRCNGASCSNFAQIASVNGTTTTYSDTSAAGSTTYGYEILAKDAAGNTSLPSNIVSVATPGIPAAPSGLTANASSATQIDLSWTNNATNQTGFKVERSPDGTTFTQIGTAGAATTTFSDPGRSPVTTYFYRVRATNSAGDSAYSNIASATTPADTTPPSTPANLTATPASSTQINLSWAASTDNVGVTSYAIWRCQGASCSNFAQVGSTASTTFPDSGLLASTSYSYEVKALDAAGNASGFSTIATATTQSSAPPPVTLVQHVETAANSGAKTISQAFPAASVAGDLIVVSVKWGDSTVSVSSVTDNLGNSYVSAVGPTNWVGTAKRGQIFFAKNIVANGSPITITATLSAASANTSVHLYQFEYTNVDPTTPIDATAASTGLGTAMSCGPLTTNFVNDLLFVIAFNDSSVTSAGAGFTTLSTFHSNIVEQMTTTSAGSYTATASNQSTSYWYMQVLAIKRHP